MRGARLFGLALAAGLLVALAAPAPAALAQERAAPPGFGFRDPVKRKPAGEAGSAERPPWGDGRAGRGPEKVPVPAGEQPYQWGFMAFAAGLMLLMVLFLVWLVRRSRRP
ncbi:MAG TPA: hypothetical protein VKZ63_16910 [Kofleriaceae bacterium]|nr:hypothetical protein [Kofleriaceae bacterium]